MHTISLINGWNFTELAQINYKDEAKKWLDFGGLVLAFKITTV